ncbi:hypothetical protein BGZ79_010653 [Entomortierella chlamydospora]|nr:hypothetical protein BGZ79_010653 [Entomortierella chlamydospora]
MNNFTNWVTDRANYERLTRKGQKASEMHKAIATYINSMNPGFLEYEKWDESLAKGRLTYSRKKYMAALAVWKKTGSGDKPGFKLLQQMQVHVPEFERYRQVYGNSLAQNPADPYETLVIGPQPQDSESESELEGEGTDFSLADSEDITATVARRTSPLTLAKRCRGDVGTTSKGRESKHPKKQHITGSIEKAINNLIAVLSEHEEQLVSARNERIWLNDEKVGLRAQIMGFKAEKESSLLLQREVLDAQKQVFAEQKAILKGREDLIKEKEEFAKAKMQFEMEVARFGKPREVIITSNQIVFRDLLAALKSTHWRAVWIYLSLWPDFHNNFLIHWLLFGISAQEIV